MHQAAQNILALINFLNAPELHRARETVRVRLAGKTVGLWTDEERREASRVCSTYDMTAMIIRMELIPGEPFLEYWGPSIRHCYEIAKPLILEFQRPENSGPNYWDGFTWLYHQVLKRSGINPGDG